MQKDLGKFEGSLWIKINKTISLIGKIYKLFKTVFKIFLGKLIDHSSRNSSKIIPIKVRLL